MTNSVHIGHLVKEKFEESGITITQLAHRINRTRTTVYDIFERKSIDIDLLLQLSEALQYDFVYKVYVPLTHREEKRYFVGVEVSEHELKDMNLEGKIVLGLENIPKAEIE